MKLQWSTEYKVYIYSAVGINVETKTIDTEYGNVAARNELEADELARSHFKGARGYECGATAVMLLDLEAFSTQVQPQAEVESEC